MTCTAPRRSTQDLVGHVTSSGAVAGARAPTAARALRGARLRPSGRRRRRRPGRRRSPAPSLTKNDTRWAMSSGWPTRPPGSATAAPLTKSSNGHAHALGGRLGHLGLDEAGGDRVGGDAELAQLDGEGLGEALQAGLGRRVVGLAAVAQRRGAGEVDDPAPLGLDHVLLRGAGHEEGAAQVHVHDRVPVGVGHLEQHVVADDAGVVDQHRRARPARRRPGRRRPRPASASLTSAPTASARPPAASIASTVPLPAASSRSRTATANPSCASRSAVAAPMPRAAPVTMATRAVSPRS